MRPTGILRIDAHVPASGLLPAVGNLEFPMRVIVVGGSDMREWYEFKSAVSET